MLNVLKIISTCFWRDEPNSPQCPKDSRVPVMLFETPSIDRFDTCINAIDRQLRWPKTHKRPQSFMCSLDCPIILHPKPPPQHPCRRYRDAPVRIGNLSERRQECRVNDGLIDECHYEQHSRYKRYRHCHLEVAQVYPTANVRRGKLLSCPGRAVVR